MQFFGFLILTFGALLIYTGYLGTTLKDLTAAVASGAPIPKRVTL
jgi:hypothetical protein